MTFTDEDLKRLKADLPSHDLCCLGGMGALIARLEAAERVIGTLPELLCGHANLYKSTFGEASDPENDLVRLKTNDAVDAWRKAAGK